MEYTIFKIKQEIIDLVAQAVNQEIDKTKLEITVPPDSKLGDFAVPCFYLTKLWRRSPNQIAKELAAKIKPAGLVKTVQNIGPYLNFFIEPKILNAEVLKEIQKAKNNYGRLNLGKEKIMIEFSQPNTHKEFHIGHLRNAVLGQSLVNLMRVSGYKVIPVNYIGDIGAHVAKCLWALEKYHQQDKLPAPRQGGPENKGKYLGQIYTEAVKKTEASEKFKKEADEVLQKLEKGDKKWLALWQKTRKWSLAEFNNIYKVLNIEFEEVFYESEMEKPGKKIVAELLKKGIAEKSEGAVIVDLEKYNLKSFLLLKSDGSSLYSTKDLALAELKFKKYKIDKSLIVTDSRQSFYFQQLFKTLELMGLKKPLVHLPYEFVTLKEGTMSSRAGQVILFEDFLAQVKAQAEQETKKRHHNWPEKKIKKIAGKITLSAIKFNLLKVGNNSIIEFDIDEALSFDGFSGPYLEYTLSRISSVFKKAKSKLGAKIDYSQLKTDLEKELILKIAVFPEVVGEAVKDYASSEIAKYLFELAKLFSNFYQTLPILSAEKEMSQARLNLIGAIRQVLINGLELLGIEAMEEM